MRRCQQAIRLRSNRKIRQQFSRYSESDIGACFRVDVGCPDLS